MKLYDFGIFAAIGFFALVFLAAYGAHSLHEKNQEKKETTSQAVAVQPIDKEISVE